MKQTIRGIVLGRTAYSETSFIVTLLTADSGLQTYLFQGARKKKGVVLFPLAPVECEIYKRSDSSMPKMTSCTLAQTVMEIPFDPIKSSIAFFMAEIIQKTIQKGHPEHGLLEFLWTEIGFIEESRELTNYSLWFLAAYTKFLGITPAVEEKEPRVFDVLGGKFQTLRPKHPAYFEGEEIHWLETFLLADRSVALAAHIPTTTRARLLDIWLAYYEQHLQGLSKLKSLDVIRTVLHA
jgi:DNA repair protein RecO (recombination protein O)